MCVWIVGVIDHKRTSETIAILRCHMRVIPKCSRLCNGGSVTSNVRVRNGTCLIQNREVVLVSIPGNDGTLRHESRSIIIICPFILKDTVPVLYLNYICQGLERNKTVNTSKCTYDSSTPLHASIGQLVFHIDTEVVALHKRPSQC